jgi:hypothetical protein
MLRFTAVVLGVLSTFEVADSVYAQARMDSGQELLNSIVRQMESQKAEAVEILCVPPQIESDVRLTADRLERGYFYKLTMPMFSLSPHYAPLVAALKRTTVMNISGPADLRWSLHVTLADGTIHRVYMDGSGRFGEIDGVRVAYAGALPAWFRSFSRIMK